LEIEAPSQQLLKDATRRYENAERTKKTISGSAAMAAYTEPGAGANAVGRGRGRGCGSEPGAREKAPWVRDPNLPYTQEQCKKILCWYNVRGRVEQFPYLSVRLRPVDKIRRGGGHP
jgi:hypothetical protein